MQKKKVRKCGINMINDSKKYSIMHFNKNILWAYSSVRFYESVIIQ